MRPLDYSNIRGVHPSPSQRLTEDHWRARGPQRHTMVGPHSRQGGRGRSPPSFNTSPCPWPLAHSPVPDPVCPHHLAHRWAKMGAPIAPAPGLGHHPPLQLSVQRQDVLSRGALPMSASPSPVQPSIPAKMSWLLQGHLRHPPSLSPEPTPSQCPPLPPRSFSAEHRRAPTEAFGLSVHISQDPQAV